ncbi:MAG TPA: zinc-finger domain-containing protein [Micavibrio sp.]|nr:zinc-finger domain-containing protein [Pseudomonadota bacterium]HIF25744.1 zinc-finger domain-containing protein [Micavibrio sp.]HIL28698.1 zinc-finger domain-containing protein [Micavibrio sp.]
MVKNAKSQNVAKPAELIVVDNDVDEVKCDGGGGALGHPMVWYSFDKGDYVECGYCDRGFVKQRSEKAYK